MLSPQDAATLDEIRRDTRDLLRAALGDARDVALVDAPNQLNVGDSMIWAGQLAHLSSLNVRVRYKADITTFDAAELRRALPSGVILIHGGGNFGDIWDGHQKFREMIAHEFTDYRIIQLPQSVLFRDPKRAMLANEILSSHPDFHLLVRESESGSRAKSMLPDVRSSFCYDMALGWTPRSISPHAPEVDALLLARTDREAASGLGEVGHKWLGGHSIAVADWIRPGGRGVIWRAERKGLSLINKLKRRYSALPAVPQWVLQHVLDDMTARNIASGQRLLSGAQILVVDRLHAHVMASLLGIPHVVLDNDHGKVGAVYAEYTNRFSTARRAESLEHAQALALDLLAA